MHKEIIALKARVRTCDTAMPARAQAAGRSETEEATRLRSLAASFINEIRTELKDHAASTKVSFGKVACLNRELARTVAMGNSASKEADRKQIEAKAM